METIQNANTLHPRMVHTKNAEIVRGNFVLAMRGCGLGETGVVRSRVGACDNTGSLTKRADELGNVAARDARWSSLGSV